MLAGSVPISGSFRVGKQGFNAPEHASDVIELVDYRNNKGEAIRAIVDSSGYRKHATAVVIPPAWGKTKETLLPLAATIVETFHRAREPVVVIRYDGIRKRGESYNEVECGFPGREHHRFAFSQGVRDIQATLDFLDSSDFRPAKTILVTFSAAAIEGRRAVALEQERLSGWISVVGAADLQSAMRVVSGGVDYLGGAERGVLFGIQEIQGVTVDMDFAAADAISNGLAFLEDARQDMAQIATPISWLHGQFDAWMDLARVQMLLGVGQQDGRRLAIVPTGHQLRSSAEALQVFQLVASEVSRLALGRELAPELPNLRSLKRRGAAERRRLPDVNLDRRKFWRDYLLGREGRLGIELMTATSAYGELMKQQLELLALNPGDSVADLGCGTGSFLAGLLELREVPKEISVHQIDYVNEALRRIRDGSSAQRTRTRVRTTYISADLELLSRNPWVPFADQSQDAVLASLLVSYVQRPEVLIREVFRVLKPGGRFVLSALRPDADTSGIFVVGSEELRRGRAREVFGHMESASLEASLRSFLNDAARLLELEERGVFQFWPEDEMVTLLKQAGFGSVRVQHGFGTPPQALVAVGRKP
jgi:ubiquinone/menaquinone biosynthesis C-methylase UbiE